ncbi:MAG: lamin tail domain-containing protein [Promethearchaeota archaeon]
MNTKRIIIAFGLSLLLICSLFIIFQLALQNPSGVDDTIPPTVTIISPTGGSSLSGVATIIFEATDTSPITDYEILVDSVLRVTSTSYDWNTTNENDGNHAILCRAKDSAGNWGEDSIIVEVDNDHDITYDDGFKVMTYNVEAGGANEDWKQVVKEENPDILIAVETGDWDDNSNQKLNAIVAEFNAYFVDENPYVGYTAQGISYSTSGEAILSRYPVTVFNQIPIVKLDDESDYDVTHDFIHAIVNISGTSVHVIGAHLKAMSGSDNEWRRERETEGIINYMDDLGNVSIMYMGDLNSFSPDDTGALAPKGDLGYGPVTMLLCPDDPVYGQYSSTQHNFTDCFRTLNPTDPGYTYGHQNPSYESRIDYIFINSNLTGKMINSTAGDTPTANSGSDHYCVDLFLNWTSSIEPDTDPPAQVTGLSATPVSISKINLSWDANTEPDLSHYRIYRDEVLIVQCYTYYYNDTGLAENTTYTYEVSAVDSSLNEGPKSTPVNCTTEVGGTAEDVVINEFLPDPDVLFTEEWIELYNPSSVAVDLSGYILDDITSGGGSPYTIPGSTIILAHGFLVFNESTTGFNLNNAGDTVNFIDTDGVTVIDSYTYSSSQNDVSYGRVTDGSPTWTTFTSPTPGDSNGTPPCPQIIFTAKSKANIKIESRFF